MMKNLITEYDEVNAFIEMYKLIRLDPKNHNLLLEKANSRYIQTHDKNGLKMRKTKLECYNNIMRKLKDLFIKYLETNCGFKFKHKTISRTNVIKHRLDIDKDPDDEDGEDEKEKRETIQEITDGFMKTIIT